MCVQASSERSTDVSSALTVCKGLERAFDAKLTSFNFILESKWGIRALGLESSCCVISPVSLVRVAVAKPKPPPAPACVHARLSGNGGVHSACTASLPRPLFTTLSARDQAGPHDIPATLEQDPPNRSPACGTWCLPTILCPVTRVTLFSLFVLTFFFLMFIVV